MPDSRLQYLFNKYYQGSCTPQEMEELMQLLSQGAHDEELQQLLDQAIREAEPEYELPPQATEDIRQAILSYAPAPEAPGTTEAPPARRPWKRWMAAAAVLLAAALTGVLWYNNRPVSTPAAPTSKYGSNVPPGREKATLVLGDGTVIDLDAAGNGRLHTQGGTAINKNGGTLVYDARSAGNSGPVVYNTITTPLGGQYHLVLPDGSKVWLNAGSSLRFPSAFRGKERSVEMSGELYFEIAGNAQQPFRVKAQEMEIAVLGTHFNVKAYREETDVRTTLLQGAVAVSSGATAKRLLPGQQAVLNKARNAIAVEAADPDQAIAWKEGRFEFNDNIEEIMRQIARWYDVEIQYEGNVISKKVFIGAISRQQNVSEVLQMLEMTGGIHFRIEGRKITVLP